MTAQTENIAREVQRVNGSDLETSDNGSEVSSTTRRSTTHARNRGLSFLRIPRRAKRTSTL